MSKHHLSFPNGTIPKEMGGEKVSIPIERLALGVVCSEPIVDDNNVLLIGANTRITQRLLSRLRDRGIHSINACPREARALSSGKQKQRSSEKTPRDRDIAAAWNCVAPIKNLLVDRFDEGVNRDRAVAIRSMVQSARESYDAIGRELKTQTLRSITRLTSTVKRYGESLLEDHDQTLSLLNRMLSRSIIAERSIQLATMGMSIAIELGLNGPKTLEVGLAGMLHDISLTLMYPQHSFVPQPTTPQEVWEYRKHPLITAQCLAEVADIPQSVQLAVQQVHEQFDGSGYPRGVHGNRIHLYARILNVADAYLQLTTGDSGLDPIVPHDAIGFLAHQAARGVFDRSIVKAFLRCETLFPLGSHVELSDGSSARVIRRPKSGYDKPVILGEDGTRMDLKHSRLEIIRPLADDRSGQVRMTRRAMRQTDWKTT